MAPNPDFTIACIGPSYLLCPLTQAAKAWTAANMPDNAPTFGRQFAVEWRDVDPVIARIKRGGLRVEVL